MKKKLLSIISVCLLLVSISSTVFALYPDQAVKFSFNTFGTGSGYVDGSSSGKYYSLTKGAVRLSVTSYIVTSTNGGSVTNRNCYVELYYNHNSYGQAIVNGTGDYKWTAPVTSTKYYLYAIGQQPCYYQNYAIEGKMKDY